jgi:hypothetical protein
MVCTLAACPTAQTRLIDSGLPTQPNSRGSYLMYRTIEQRLRRQAAGEAADHRAVLRRDVENVIGGDDRARPGHVLDDDRWVARDVPPHVARQQPAP